MNLSDHILVTHAQYIAIESGILEKFVVQSSFFEQRQRRAVV